MSIKEFTTDEALLSTPCEKATAEDAAVAQDLLDTLASLELRLKEQRAYMQTRSG